MESTQHTTRHPDADNPQPGKHTQNTPTPGDEYNTLVTTDQHQNEETPTPRGLKLYPARRTLKMLGWLVCARVGLHSSHALDTTHEVKIIDDSPI